MSVCAFERESVRERGRERESVCVFDVDSCPRDNGWDRVQRHRPDLPPGSYLRLIDSCITQLKAQGPSGACNESKEEKEASDFHFSGIRISVPGFGVSGVGIQV